MLITSIENEKIKKLKKLNIRKYRRQTGLFLIEGEHLIYEAYKSGFLTELILLENTVLPIEIKTIHVSENVMRELSNLTNPPMAVGVCKIKDNSVNLGDRILLLDNIQDPGNLGTIIRSAVAFNVDTIIIGHGTVDLYNSKVLRATQGLIFHINIFEADILEFIPKLKDNNYIIIGTNVEEGTELSNYKTPSKYALIMGNEGSGISDNIKSLCDDVIFIKTNYLCESLNVGIACSIILYQLDKR